MTNNHQKLGVGVIIIRENKVLLGKRIGALGANTWSFPGGHLEWGESVFDCAAREVAEETGFTDLSNFRYGPYTRDVFEKEDKQYITLFVIADLQSGEPKVMEPDRCLEWQWFGWDDLPEPLFLPMENLLQLDFNPFELPVLL